MISFKTLSKEIVEKSNYVIWINDKNINRFLEVRWTHQSKNNLYEYVENSNKSQTEFLFGIFVNDEERHEKHIGNIKIYNINYKHKFADISIVIGEPKFHNKGIALKSINFIKDFAKNKIKLRKITSSSYSSNKASIKLFLKSNFIQVAEFKNHYYDGDMLVHKVYFEYFL